MALRDWVGLPSKWIENGGLKEFRWNKDGVSGADRTAALMLLLSMAHHADQDTGRIKMTYDQLSMATGLSRAKISSGLMVLAKTNLVARISESQSFYCLVDYDLSKSGWCKIPARRLYGSEQIAAFKDFSLRRPTELHALKLYLLFAARRSNATNTANISYEKIEEYSGIGSNHIKSAVSFLAALGLVLIDHVPSGLSEYGVSNAYRLTHLDARKHQGTQGKRMTASDFESVL